MAVLRQSAAGTARYGKQCVPRLVERDVLEVIDEKRN